MVRMLRLTDAFIWEDLPTTDPVTGSLDSTYPEIHNYYSYNRHCFSCCSYNNTLYINWRPSFHVWNMVSLRCHKNTDLRADQHITGKSVCNQVGLRFIDLNYVTGMQRRPSEYFDFYTSDGMSVKRFRCVYVYLTQRYVDQRILYV